MIARLPFLALLLCVACGGPSDPEGTWEYDPDRTAELLLELNADLMPEYAEEWATNLTSTVPLIRLDTNGKAHSDFGDAWGTWERVEDKVRVDLGVAGEETYTLDGDSLVFDGDKARPRVFRRR